MNKERTLRTRLTLATLLFVLLSGCGGGNDEPLDSQNPNVSCAAAGAAFAAVCDGNEPLDEHVPNHPINCADNPELCK